MDGKGELSIDEIIGILENDSLWLDGGNNNKTTQHLNIKKNKALNQCSILSSNSDSLPAKEKLRGNSLGGSKGAEQTVSEQPFLKMVRNLSMRCLMIGRNKPLLAMRKNLVHLLYSRMLSILSRINCKSKLK